LPVAPARPAALASPDATPRSAPRPADRTTNTDPRFYVSSKGEVKAAVPFVDFPDVQAGALNSQSVYDLFVPR